MACKKTNNTNHMCEKGPHLPKITFPSQGGGGDFHVLRYGMCHFLRVLFQQEDQFLGLFHSL